MIRNRNVVTSLAQAESQRLQNEYNLAFEVYKGLATQLEQAKIKGEGRDACIYQFWSR
jgi:hypothetical protein